MQTRTRRARNYRHPLTKSVAEGDPRCETVEGAFWLPHGVAVRRAIMHRTGSALPENLNKPEREVVRRNGQTSVGLAALAIWIAFLSLCQSAGAEVSISGTPGAVRIEARQASIDEVLRALQTSFKLRYSASGAIGGLISGTYSGSLPSVIARILDGHNYVMHGSADDLQVLLLTTGTSAMKPAALAAPAQPGSAASGSGPVKECQYNGIPVEC
jgi:hypothetical protein